MKAPVEILRNSKTALQGWKLMLNCSQDLCGRIQLRSSLAADFVLIVFLLATVSSP
jgi:hypothetical protein